MPCHFNSRSCLSRKRQVVPHGIEMPGMVVHFCPVFLFKPGEDICQLASLQVGEICYDYYKRHHVKFCAR